MKICKYGRQVKKQSRLVLVFLLLLFPFEVKVISRPFKTTIKCICPVPFSRFLFGNFLQIVIKASLAEFIFSKIPCFHHILLLNTLRLMWLNYENCSLRHILFYNLAFLSRRGQSCLLQTLKQHSDYKSLIAKTFDGNTLTMKL